MSDILQYDLLSNNSLLDDDFTSKRNKHMLVKKLEEKKRGTRGKQCFSCRLYVTHKPYTRGSIIWEAVFFWILLYHLFSKQYSFEYCSENIKGIYKFNQIDIIYDSYVDDLLKECERLRRSKYDPIHLNDIEFDTGLPIQPEGFGASGSKKEKLQTLSWI